MAEHEAQSEPNTPLPAVPYANGHHPGAKGAEGQAQEPEEGPPANVGFELHRRGTDWLAPPQEAMEAVLAAATDVPLLQTLHVKAAAIEGVAKGVHVPFEELCRLAEFRIEIERKMGVLLSQTVHAGRHTKLSHGAIITGTGGLPPGISLSMSSRYQQLAAIDEDAVKRCFLEARSKGRVPSSEGLLRSAGFKKSPTTRPRARCKAPATVDCPSAVADAIARFMKVGTCVGDAPAFSSAKRVPAVLKSIEKLRGVVFVTECPDPDAWLPELANAERKRQVEEVAVVLPAGTGKGWFARVTEGSWQCCFLRGEPAGMVVYHGERRHAFWLVMRSLGSVMEAGKHD